jgi:hypothetical protein
MRRCVLFLAAAGALVLGGALAYRSLHPAQKPAPPAAVNMGPSGPEGAAGEAAWRYRLCQPRHWRYLLLNK